MGEAGRGHASVGTSRKRPPVPYWEFAHAQAQHLVTGVELQPGEHYALTEVVHCKSANERGVAAAVTPCATRYLSAVLAISPARVVVAAGKQAADAIELVFRIPPRPVGTVVGPLVLAGRERLLLYLPHPGRVRRSRDPEAMILPNAVTAGQLKQLQAAVMTGISTGQD
jgi:hypothetical protein